MRWEAIHKDTAPGVTPNLAAYDQARWGLTWSHARDALAGLPSGGLNMACEAVDRHAGPEHGDKVAPRCIAHDNAVPTVTYTELARRTARFANVLRSLGVGHADRVFTLLGRCDVYWCTADPGWVVGMSYGIIAPLAEVPIPYARRLEEATLPQTADIVAAAHRAVD
ncbi:hypothetical protein [Streptomyces sp. NPDC056227]|uniref:hypothetical protein n=1 Tax=Streptomyces sp. NPDC056227 TaxID=3345753 RepID=UPI0035DF9B8B